LFFIRSAHIVLDVQCSIQLPSGRFFPRPVQPLASPKSSFHTDSVAFRKVADVRV
jgi:hypothetical protein